MGNHSKVKQTSRLKRKETSPDYCEICKYNRIVQRHRILPGREGGKYHLGNVISLCPTCHAEADRGWITREDLFEIVNYRISQDAIQAKLFEEHTSIEGEQCNSPEKLPESSADSIRDAYDAQYTR